LIYYRNFSIIAAVLFLAVSSSYADESERSDLKKQYDFAESLFADGDYFRAITEYKRFLFYHSQDQILMEKSAFRIAESCFKARRWEEAIIELTRFIDQYPESTLRIDAVFLKGLSEKQIKAHEAALSTFNTILKESSPVYYDKAVYQIALIRLEQRQWQEAKDALGRVPTNSPIFKSAKLLSSGLDRMENIRQKDPIVAGTLAAFLPGAGHLYAGRAKDAMVSFLLNGSFIWAAVELYDHKNYAAAAIVTLFELGWYSGNIYSAASSAHKYNRKAQNRFIENLLEYINLSYYYDPANQSNYVMFSAAF
jgi:TolA-binding protein